MKSNAPDAEQHQMNISQLSKKSGFSSPTIRYYIQLGLLHRPTKISHTVAHYHESHLQKLSRIKRLRKEQGLSLSEINALFKEESTSTPQETDNGIDKREQIIQTALDFFSKNGFAETKISDVAKAVGIGQATFYFYFKSKEALFMTCVEHMSRVLSPEDFWKGIKDEEDYATKQRLKLSVLLNSFSKFSVIFNSLKIFLESDNPNLADLAKDAFRTLLRPIILDLRKASKAGMIREIDEVLLAYCTLWNAEGLGYATRMNPDYTIDDAMNISKIIYNNGVLPYSSLKEKKALQHPIYFDVTDSEGTKTHIHDARFGDHNYFVKGHGQGELRIKMENITDMDFEKAGLMTSVSITLMSNEQVIVKIKDDRMLSGKTPYGAFFIPVCKILNITRIR